MPKIIIQAIVSDGTPGPVTLDERAVPTDLHGDHYVLQLIERLGWALADAEEIEASHSSVPSAAQQVEASHRSVPSVAKQAEARQGPVRPATFARRARRAGSPAAAARRGGVVA